MTPLYASSDGAARLYLGDCRQVVPSLPADDLADLALADPPYGDTSLAWDKRVDGWLEAVESRLKPNASLWIFGSMRFLLASARHLRGWSYAQDVVWEKQNGSSLAADRFRRVHEHAVQFYRGKWGEVFKEPQYTRDAVAKQVRLKRGGPAQWGSIEGSPYASEDGGPRLQRSVLRFPNLHGSAIHPTEKPVALLRTLIAYACPPGGLVLDPFAGSGSTLVAAMESGRRAVGVELNPGYAASAATRITFHPPWLKERT